MYHEEGLVPIRSVAGGDAEIDLTGSTPSIAPLFDAHRIYQMPDGIYVRLMKPVVDWIGAVIALILLTPVLLAISLAIWVAMGSPVIFKQPRVGQFGKVFGLYKFRTMAPDRRGLQAEIIGEDRRVTHKSPHDPRITPLGRWLRASRLDELPQFLNVLLGHLSLVGPRPELVPIVAEYETWQHRRHAVKPGITGLWQISDNGDKLLRECTEMELAYLNRVSVQTDLSIIAKTIPAMVRRRGI